MAGEPEKKDGNKEEKKEEAAKPAKKKPFLLIGIAAAVVIGLGAGAFVFMKGKSAHKAEPTEAEASVEAAPEPAHGGGHGGGHGEAKAGGSASILTLDPFIVNLQDNSGTRYLKLTINLELAQPASTAEVTAQMTKIRDSLIILLSSKSYSDIGSVEGKYQMRDEIVARINQFLAKNKVKTAYFTDLVIQ